MLTIFEKINRLFKHILTWGNSFLLLNMPRKIPTIDWFRLSHTPHYGDSQSASYNQSKPMYKITTNECQCTANKHSRPSSNSCNGCLLGEMCNVRGVSAVRFTTRSRTHCTRPIRTSMHSTPENREAHKRQQRLQGTERERQSDPQKGSHITGTFSSNIKCTILFIYGPSSLNIPNPVLRLSRITTAVLPAYTALPLP